MALLNFHYLITAFGFTVWTHAPFIVVAFIYAFQAIAFIAGIDVTDLNDYVFWNFLTSVAGAAVGVGFLLVTRVPQFLKFKPSYVGVWGQFILWGVLFIAAQLFYGFFPPPTYPWGIIGTAVAHLIIQVVLWVVMYYNDSIFAGYEGKKYMFFLWIIVLLVMEFMFFIAYVLLERWVAYISAGTGAVILIIAALVFPLKMPYRNPTPGEEPLIISKTGSGGGTQGKEKDEP